MRKYRNDSLINEHKSVYNKTTTICTIIQLLALFKLHTIKRNERQACCRTTCRVRRRPLTSDDSRTGVQRTNQFNRRHNASSDCCRSGLHQDRTTSPTLSCSCFVADSLPPRVSTDVTQRRRDDNLQVIWRASQRVLCSKLHYLRHCRPKITSI